MAESNLMILCRGKQIHVAVYSFQEKHKWRDGVYLIDRTAAHALLADEEIPRREE